MAHNTDLDFAERAGGEVLLNDEDVVQFQQAKMREEFEEKK